MSPEISKRAWSAPPETVKVTLASGCVGVAGGEGHGVLRVLSDGHGGGGREHRLSSLRSTTVTVTVIVSSSRASEAVGGGQDDDALVVAAADAGLVVGGVLEGEHAAVRDAEERLVGPARDGVGDRGGPVGVGGRVGADRGLALVDVGRGGRGLAVAVAVAEDRGGLVGVGDRHGDGPGGRVGGGGAVARGHDDHVVLAAAVGGGGLVVRGCCWS